MRVDAARLARRVLFVVVVSGFFASAASHALGSGFEGLRLMNVAGRVGLDFRQGAFRFGVSPDPAAMTGGGLCALDYNNDGWVDLFVVNSYSQADVDRWRTRGGLPRSALFRNTKGWFTDVSRRSKADLAVRGEGCVAADLNLDGFTDLYVTTAGYDKLLWNNGDGTFTEGARAAGIRSYGWHAGVADVNGDGPQLQVAGTRFGCCLRRQRRVETRSSISWTGTRLRRARGSLCSKWWRQSTRFRTSRARRMSSAISNRAGRSTTRIIDPPRGKGAMLERPEILYTAEAAATGGREGHAATSDGRVDVELAVPKEMGGSGRPGTNPEQLFAVGYAACFQSALLRFANGRGLDLSESRVTARVGIGLLRSGGIGLAVALDLDAPGLSRDVAVDLMNRAHETCPYSRATRGNIVVTLTVSGSSVERQAA